MATFLSRLPRTLTLASYLSRSFSTTASVAHSRSSSLFLLHRLRPLAGAIATARGVSPSSVLRSFSTNATSSSLKDPSPNWSNRPPKETILLDGCDFEHWLVVMEPPEGEPTRDDIIDSYIKTLSQVVGSEEEARMKIYSVSTRCYYAFGALVSEEISYKIKELPRVRWVLPDSYLDVRNKDYGGEPFIDGKAVPYDPKYHEEWIRNNARANERNRRNDRPRNFDRSRNFERRRENMQNQDFQRGPPVQNAGPNPQGPPGSNTGLPLNRGVENMQNQDFQRRPPVQNAGPNPQGPPGSNIGPPPNRGGIPQNNMGGYPPPNNMNLPNNYGGAPPSNNWSGGPPNNYGGAPNNYGGAPNNYGGAPNNYGGAPPSNYGGAPPSNFGGAPPNNGGAPPSNYGGAPPNNGGAPPSNYGGAPPNNMGGGPPPNMGGMQQNNAGWSGNAPNNEYQNSYTPDRDASGGNY
ncbi:hypothetical protein L484_018677 [Morus notabilis]|uniref:MORF/ORRM1/DAG-like MORF domain-containing protein n=1 Tax=Morus notabilis TaxID=981085 RepID=W9S797_9ROSA|nr:multiple organellar RNA editing factor 8, chloroplastic/mitochondrial [Morus notabilis]EXC18496.1 hypothetical protein L484_018677 [Morus notabilis]